MMAVVGPSEALRRLTRRPGANFGGVIRSGPTLHSRSPSDNNGFARGVFRNQPGVTLLTCMAIFAAARYFAIKRRRVLNGKDLNFDARFAGPGAGRNPEATRLFKRPQHRNQS